MRIFQAARCAKGAAGGHSRSEAALLQIFRQQQTAAGTLPFL
jgi:hypothetical protein